MHYKHSQVTYGLSLFCYRTLCFVQICLITSQSV